MGFSTRKSTRGEALADELASTTTVTAERVRAVTLSNAYNWKKWDLEQTRLEEQGNKSKMNLSRQAGESPMISVMPRIPIPDYSVRTLAFKSRKYPFDKLEVGDWFFLPGRTKNNLSTYACTVSKKLGKTFATRLLYVLNDVKVDADTDGAVLGVGVWRIS